MKKAIIYSPYLDTAGGGERYCLTVAECLLNKNWQVDVFWDDKKDITRIKQRLNLNIGKVNLIGARPESKGVLKTKKLLNKYDFCFWLSNGSLPFLTAKNNVVHFQRPFINIGGKSLPNRFKLMFINNIVCNSKFTKRYIDQEFGISSKVLYPPVDIDQFRPADKKENIIIGVGRFDQSGSKKQDILIEAFRQMVDNGLKSWKLVLVGGSLTKPSKNQYLRKIKKRVGNYPIDIMVNADFSKLKQVYAKSKLFWHAAGYGVEESRRPWETEHFGITPVEAMASGCVPLVVNKGGLPEIVRRDTGEKWSSIKELNKKTLDLINDKQKLKKYQQKAISRSKAFSKSKFCNNLNEIIRNN